MCQHLLSGVIVVETSEKNLPCEGVNKTKRSHKNRKWLVGRVLWKNHKAAEEFHAQMIDPWPAALQIEALVLISNILVYKSLAVAYRYQSTLLVPVMLVLVPDKILFNMKSRLEAIPSGFQLIFRFLMR